MTPLVLQGATAVQAKPSQAKPRITSVPTSSGSIDYEASQNSSIDDISTDSRAARLCAWLGVQRAFAWHPETFAKLFEDARSPSVSVLESWIEVQLKSSGRAWRSAADRDVRQLDSLGGELMARDDDRYPESLAALLDPPVAMLVRGKIEVLDTPSIAIIGARAATRTALKEARSLGRELAARGFTIVSGLARGVDAEAHWGALEAGGITVAVIASGLDQVYPPEHRNLAERIAEQGAVVTEMPLGTAPRRELFPLRNRIISGLCQGVIVVEARKRSGSLITVRHALAQGREVFVVPGSIDGPFAAGSNQLLRDGARALLHSGDVVEDLLGEPETRTDPSRNRANRRSHPAQADQQMSLVDQMPAPTGLEAELLTLLEAGPETRDALLLGTASAPRDIAAALLDLELAGRVVEERDGRFHRVWSQLLADGEKPS